MEEMLDTKVAAERLHISRDTLHKWIQHNKIAYVRISHRKVLIPVSAIEKKLTVVPERTK